MEVTEGRLVSTYEIALRRSTLGSSTPPTPATATRVEISRPSYDINVQALTGIMTRQVEPGQPPIYLGHGLRRYVRRHHVGARHHDGAARAPDGPGKGQHIDASLYGAQLMMSAPTLQPFLASQTTSTPSSSSRKDARNPLWNRYQAEDKWVFLCEENDDARWAKLCQSFGREEPRATDSRFASADDRLENHRALVAEIDGIIVKRAAPDEWMDAWAAARHRGEPDPEPEGHRRGSPGLGERLLPEDPLQRGRPRGRDPRAAHHASARRPGSVETLGPELGQDTEILLMELLEMEWEKHRRAEGGQGVIP